MKRLHSAYTEAFLDEQEDGSCKWRAYVHSHKAADKHLEETAGEAPSRAKAAADAKAWSEQILNDKYLLPVLEAVEN